MYLSVALLAVLMWAWFGASRITGEGGFYSEHPIHSVTSQLNMQAQQKKAQGLNLRSLMNQACLPSTEIVLLLVNVCCDRDVNLRPVALCTVHAVGA